MKKFINNPINDSYIENILDDIENGVVPCQFDIFNARNELKYLKTGIDYLKYENDDLRNKIYKLTGAKVSIG